MPLRTLAAYVHAVEHWAPREAFLSALAEWLPSYATVGDAITLDELILLADCYYLPHENGPEACRLYEVAERLIREPVDAWNGADDRFAELNHQVQTTFDKLTQLHNRELFYAWSRRAWDLKEELQLIEGYLPRRRPEWNPLTWKRICREPIAAEPSRGCKRC